jgi:hypothetical protein
MDVSFSAASMLGATDQQQVNGCNSLAGGCASICQIFIRMSNLRQQYVNSWTTYRSDRRRKWFLQTAYLKSDRRSVHTPHNETCRYLLSKITRTLIRDAATIKSEIVVSIEPLIAFLDLWQFLLFRFQGIEDRLAISLTADEGSTELRHKRPYLDVLLPKQGVSSARLNPVKLRNRF